MKNSFLDFYQTIISKVSFNRQLLYKEARKALRYLSPVERRQFLKWFKENYAGQNKRERQNSH